MASSPESYAVEREFADSMDDPFEAILDLRARVVELEDELRQLRTARDRIAADDGLTTMEVKLEGGSMVVGHGVIVTPDQRGEVVVGRRLPRQIGDVSPVPADDRHCAECGAPPPNRWWQLDDFIDWPRTEIRNKHMYMCPTFLCDHCTGITPDMIADRGERTRRDDEMTR